MKKVLLILIVCCSSAFVLAQDCQNGESFYPNLVEIRAMESREIPNGYRIVGEALADIEAEIHSLEEMTEATSDEIRSTAARYKSCITYVDLNGYYDSPDFPTMQSQLKVYYYWVMAE